MPSYEHHEPSYDDTTTGEWSAPAMEDFDTDDLSAIADHFLLSASGFPPENFSDLKLPVVDPDGALNLNALETAHGGGHGVDQIEGIGDETVSEVESTIERLAREEFDHEIAQ